MVFSNICNLIQLIIQLIIVEINTENIGYRNLWLCLSPATPIALHTLYLYEQQSVKCAY